MNKNTNKKNKQLKLSQKGKVAVLMTLSGLTSTAMAQIEAVDTNLVQVTQQYFVDVVNIAKPNTAGLSHNQFNDFNVGVKGAVMNNALKAGTSQLAGNLNANTNFDGKAASVILNEVISRNPSLLLGEQEVFGIAADYVLANPNGISCNDCGFINTPRASLVVGTPTLDGNKLAGFDVNNNNQLTASGTINTEAVLNLIAPKMNVNAEITAGKDVNFVLGSNTIEINEDTVKATKSTNSDTVIDGKFFGSIQAGSIRVHAADTRSSVEATSVDWDAEEISVTAGSAHFNGTVSDSYEQLADNDNSDTHSRSNRSRIKEESTNSILKEYYNGSSLDADKLAINVADTLSISATEINANRSNASSVSLVGKSVDVSTIKTTNVHKAQTTKSKGSWSDDVKRTAVDQTLYTTEVSADNITIVAENGDVNAQSIQLKANNVAVAGNNVFIGGDTKKYDNTMVHEFKNDGSKLKTGSTLNQVGDDIYVASTIEADQLFIAGKNNVTLDGTKAHVTTAGLSGKSINLGVESSGETTKKVYQETYWGGMFGGTAEKDIINKNIQNGTAINARGKVALVAQDVLTIEGSRVSSGEGTLVEADTQVNLISAQDTIETTKGHRKGSLFNITKEAEENWKLTKSNKASDLHSNADISLVSKDEINVVGSQLAAAGVLELDATKVNVAAGETHTSSTSHQAGWEQPEYTLNDTNITDIDASVNGIIGLVKKKGLGASASIGVEFFDKNKHVEKTEAAASSLTGGTGVTIGANTNVDTVTVSGSDIATTNGDVSINADEVVTEAATTTTVTDVNDTTVGLGIAVDISKKHASNAVTIDVSNTQGTTTENTAEVSSISAANGTVNISGTNIAHEGTQISANEVNQNADKIDQTAATSSTSSDINHVDVNLGVTLTGEFTGGVSGGATVNASGSNTKKQTTTAEVTSISADSVTINAENTVSDEGTNYQGGDVAISAGDYDNTAAANTTNEESNGGSGGITVNAGSSDMINVSVDGSVSAGYEHTHSQSSEAVQSDINVDTISINADNSINTEANITATGDVTLVADSINQNQSVNTSSSESGGFGVEVGAGAVISVATGGTPVPTIDVAASAHGGNASATTGVGTSISGANVTIDANDDVSLQGASISATDAVAVSGSAVSVTGTTATSKKLDIEAGVSVNLTEELSEIGIGGKLGVQNEQSQGGEAVSIVGGETVNLDALEYITLVGATVEATQVDVNTANGDVHIAAINNTEKKNNIAAELNLSGSTDETLEIGAGSGSLNAEIASSSTHTDAGIKGEDVQLSAHDVTLVGANVIAENIEGSVSGTLTTENVVNTEKKTTVNIDVNGSGKVDPSKKELVQDGKLGGIDAGLKFDLEHNKQVSNQTAGITATNDALDVANSTIDTALVEEVDQNIGVDFEISTDVEAMKEQAKKDLINGNTPIVHVDGVDAPHKEIVSAIHLPTVVQISSMFGSFFSKKK